MFIGPCMVSKLILNVTIFSANVGIVQTFQHTLILPPLLPPHTHTANSNASRTVKSVTNQPVAELISTRFVRLPLLDHFFLDHPSLNCLFPDLLRTITFLRTSFPGTPSF